MTTWIRKWSFSAAVIIAMGLSLGTAQAQTPPAATKEVQVEKIHAEKLLASTLKQAAKQKKHVLVHLGAPW